MYHRQRTKSVSYTWIAIIFILGALYIPNTIYAADKPLPYKINAPNIVKIKTSLIELQWRQIEKTLVVVYKQSETRKSYDDCGWIGDNYKAQYCKVVFTKRNLVGNMRIRDKDYKPGDEYYILQYVYQTHNGAYGPFTIQ